MFNVQTSKVKEFKVQWIKIISVISEIRSWYYFAIMIRKTVIRLRKIFTYSRLIPLQSHDKIHLKSCAATDSKSVGYKSAN